MRELDFWTRCWRNLSWEPKSKRQRHARATRLTVSLSRLRDPDFAPKIYVGGKNLHQSWIFDTDVGKIYVGDQNLCESVIFGPSMR